MTTDHLTTTADRDDTTRYLCAAAHLDPAYADQAIREFLLEPTRPVPPSPGVDAGVVLAEAVAARARRRIVDLAALALLVVLLAAASWSFLLVWLVLAIVVATATMARSATGNPLRPLLWSVGALSAFLLLNAITQGDVIESLVELVEDGPSYRGGYYDEDGYLVTDDTDGVGLAFTVLGSLALLGVFLADRVSVWRLITTRFHRRVRLRGTLGTALAGRQIFQFAPARFTRALRERYQDPVPRLAPGTDPTDSAQVVVHRGYDPFVGAGVGHKPWSIAAPLERAKDREAVDPLSTAALYEAIATEVTHLRDATSLTPAGRLGRLTADELIAVSAAELIDHLGDPASVPFLAAEGHAPYDRLARELTNRLRDHPMEWARYYQTFRVETWDRDLVLSIYVHVALDDTMLYVEWTPCVLKPIKAEFQRIDTLSRSPLQPLGQALLDLLRFPATLPRRLASTLTVIRRRRKEPGVPDPDDYGTLSSLRELAAGTEMRSYFQLVDRDRYLKIVESRVVRAVSGLLAEAGYVTAGFDAQVTAVIQNNVAITGNVTGNVVAGAGNRTGDVKVKTPTNGPK